MHEHITRALYYFDIHLLYASFGRTRGMGSNLHPSVAAPPPSIGSGWRPRSISFCPWAQSSTESGSSHLSWAAPLGIIGDIREYHLSRPDRYDAFRSVAAWRNAHGLRACVCGCALSIASSSQSPSGTLPRPGFIAQGIAGKVR